MVHVINGSPCLHFFFIIMLCVPFGTWYSDDICGDKSVNYVEYNLLAADTQAWGLCHHGSHLACLHGNTIVALKGKYLRAQKLKTLVNSTY